VQNREEIHHHLREAQGGSVTIWRGRALVGCWPGRPVQAAIRAIARDNNFKCDIEATCCFRSHSISEPLKQYRIELCLKMTK
jgi:hypothetical protein